MELRNFKDFFLSSHNSLYEISTRGTSNIDIKYCHINYIRIINYKEYPPDSAE